MKNNYHILNKLAFVCSLFVFTTGFVVLFGWHAHFPRLIQIQPHWVAMQYNTALGFVLSALSVIAVIKNKKNIAVFLSILIFLIGSLTLFQYISGFDLNIDELFIKHYITTKASHPGRMAPNTALCFVIFSFYCFTSLIKKRNLSIFISSLLSIILGSLALIAFIGYLTDLETAYVWGNLTRMALHTTIGFSFLSFVALLLIIRETLIYSIFNWMPYAMALSVFVVTICIWYAFKTADEKIIHNIVYRQSESLSASIENKLFSLNAALRRMRDRWEYNRGTSTENFIHDAKNYVYHEPSHISIYYIDKFNHVQNIVSKDELQKQIGTQFLKSPTVISDLQTAKNKDKEVISNFINLSNQIYGYLLIEPIFIDKQFEGYIVGLFSLERLMTPILDKNEPLRGYEFSLFHKGNSIYNWGTLSTKNTRYRHESFVKLNGKKWTYFLTPSHRYLNSLKSRAPLLVLIFGFLITIVAYYLAYLWHKNYKIRLKLEELSNHLEDKVQERTKELEQAKSKAIAMMLHAETAKKEIEKYANQLKIKQKALKHSHKQLEQFAYIASHDLQEPLRKIQGFGDLLETESQTKLNEDEQIYLKKIQQSALRMSQLISDLLQYSLLTRSKEPFVDVDLQTTVQGVLSDLEVTIQESNAQIVIANDLPTIQANPIQIRQLFQNLIGNAMKYVSPKTKPKINIQCESKKDVIQIIISDNGIGIEDEHIPKIFAPFKRLHSKTQYKGTGIGLSLVQKIVETHGGKIYVKSKVNEGSQFIIEFPK